jgi:hypothetical protein
MGGRGGRGHQEDERRDQQNRNQYQYGGRHMSTGRSDHGGQYDYIGPGPTKQVLLDVVGSCSCRPLYIYLIVAVD